MSSASISHRNRHRAAHWTFEKLLAVWVPVLVFVALVAWLAPPWVLWVLAVVFVALWWGWLMVEHTAHARRVSRCTRGARKGLRIGARFGARMTVRAVTRSGVRNREHLAYEWRTARETQRERDRRPMATASLREAKAWYRDAWKGYDSGPLGALTKVEHPNADLTRFYVKLPERVFVTPLEGGKVNTTAIAMQEAVGRKARVPFNQILVYEGTHIGTAIIEIRYRKPSTDFKAGRNPHTVANEHRPRIEDGIALGVQRTGPVNLPLRNKHSLFAGASGQGKTTCIRSVLLGALALRNAGEPVTIILIDGKGEFPDFQPYVDRYSNTHRDALEHCNAIMQRRIDAKARDRNLYLIVIDEVAMIPADDQLELLKPLTSFGRSYGLHVVIGVQRGTSGDLSPDILTNLTNRIVGGLASAGDYRYLTNNAGDLTQDDLTPGEFMVRLERQWALTRTYDLDEDAATRWLQSHGVPARPADGQRHGQADGQPVGEAMGEDGPHPSPMPFDQEQAPPSVGEMGEWTDTEIDTCIVPPATLAQVQDKNACAVWSLVARINATEQRAANQSELERTSTINRRDIRRALDAMEKLNVIRYEWHDQTGRRVGAWAVTDD